MEDTVQNKIGIIFTLDWEIHGNGSGLFEDYAHFPTAEMLKVFDKNGAKLTIMAEMWHYWAMKNYPDIFQKEINLFETQLKQAIETGHDVQLHLHPQWMDAKYENGEWAVPFDKEHIALLCNSYEESYKFLKRGKTDLETLLKPINADYSCIGFRAGFFQLQPSIHVLKALSELGYLSDTSVAKGMVVHDNLRDLDYSDAVSHYLPWKADYDNVSKSSEQSIILEFPVCSPYNYLPPRFEKYKGDRRLVNLIADFSRSILSKNSVKTSGGDTIRMIKKKKSVISRLTEKKYKYLDFCTEDKKHFLKRLKRTVDEAQKQKNTPFIPLVVLGHSKDFMSPPNLRHILEEISNWKNVSFLNYRDAIKIYNEN